MNELTRKLRCAWFVSGCWLLAACSSDQSGAGGAAGSAHAGSGSGNGMAGASSMGGAAQAGASQAQAGSAGTPSGNGGTNAQGGDTGQSGAGPQGGGSAQGGAGAQGFSLTPHVLTVTMGKVFNNADDYFDDGFVPPSPLANFGFQTPIVPFVHADGSLDVAWLDYTNGQGKPFALSAPGMIYITHVDPSLSTSSTVATGIQSYRLLGFTVDPSGNFYLAYNADHPFKSTGNDVNNVQGNELRIAKSSAASFANKAWDTLVFGDKDNTKDLSKGNAGGAGSGVLGFDSTNMKLVAYLAHSMAWGDNGTRHQAGYFGLFDPSTGVRVATTGQLLDQTGAGWFYSHNFDQRLLIDGGTSYTLAHGDANARQLGFSAWSLASYTKNGTVFDQPYFTIAGTHGDNNTDTETGQFIKLSDGRFVMVHTTSQGRSARDVRIVLVDGTTGMASSEAWLTNNTGKIQATMPKVEVLGGQLFVTYGLWDSTDRTNKRIDYFTQFTDLSLKPMGPAQPAANVEFVRSSPLFRFSSGPNAGKVGWAAGNATHTLNVNVAQN